MRMSFFRRRLRWNVFGANEKKGNRWWKVIFWHFESLQNQEDTMNVKNSHSSSQCLKKTSFSSRKMKKSLFSLSFLHFNSSHVTLSAEEFSQKFPLLFLFFSSSFNFRVGANTTQQRTVESSLITRSEI